MQRKISFKTRIVFIFTMIIALFTVGIILFEQQQFKSERTRSLERTLENNADIVYRYLNESGIDLQKEPGRITGMLHYMPSDVRFTIISWEGQVLYDNLLEAGEMGNHLKRPEVQKSIGFGKGSNIRLSESDNIE